MQYAYTNTRVVRVYAYVTPEVFVIRVYVYKGALVAFLPCQPLDVLSVYKENTLGALFFLHVHII